MRTQDAINILRTAPDLDEQMALVAVNTLLGRFSDRTAIGEALLVCSEDIEEAIAADALELAADAYRRSAYYKTDKRNEAVARGA